MLNKPQIPRGRGICPVPSELAPRGANLDYSTFPVGSFEIRAVKAGGMMMSAFNSQYDDTAMQWPNSNAMHATEVSSTRLCVGIQTSALVENAASKSRLA